jgi:homoserine dehydrogenase
MDIALIGFGNVGQGFVQILLEKRDYLTAHYDFLPRIVAVATHSRGILYHPAGLDLQHLLTAIEKGSLRNHYPPSDGLLMDCSVENILCESSADVVIEASPTDLQTGQPALNYCHAALNSGKHLVLANKGPIAVDFAALKRRAGEVGSQLYFEAVVMAGTPSLRLALESLAGCTIMAARGILNGTTNYILTCMENGMSYADALLLAQQKGYAEADPTADVEGWDAAGKAMILSAVLFGKTLKQIEVTGITGITTRDIADAQAAGERWKLVAEVTPIGGRVMPQRLPLTHPLAGVSGATNAVTYTTDLLGDVTLVGAGAGRKETGFALLSDLLAIHRNLQG